MENQFTTETTIKINWWSSDKKLITSAERQILEERGLERAIEMIQQGLTGGELNEEELYTDDENVIRNFIGWFELSSKSVD